MSKKSIYIGIVIVVLLIIGYFGYYKFTNHPITGGAVSGQLIEDVDPYFRNNGGMNTNLPIQMGGTSTFTLGSTGTAITAHNFGTCYIAPYAATIAASSTVSVDCQGTLAWGASGTSALTGITSADNVQLQLSTTTAVSTLMGLHVAGVSASTTAGHIELKISNMTGTTYTWPTTAGTASGTAMYVGEN